MEPTNGGSTTVYNIFSLRVHSIVNADCCAYYLPSRPRHFHSNWRLLYFAFFFTSGVKECKIIWKFKLCKKIPSPHHCVRVCVSLSRYLWCAFFPMPLAIPSFHLRWFFKPIVIGKIRDARTSESYLKDKIYKIWNKVLSSVLYLRGVFEKEDCVRQKGNNFVLCVCAFCKWHKMVSCSFLLLLL